MELYRDTSEMWRDISGYEGQYQASTYGRIRSLPRQITQKGHKCYFTRTMKGKILQPRKQNANYYIVWLSNRKVQQALLVHRLVAETFIPNPENKPQVNHINGIKTDNRIDNLEWCSCSENIKHSHKIGGRKEVSKPIICIEPNRKFPSIISASREMNINSCSISHALNGRAKTAGGYTWKFI